MSNKKNTCVFCGKEQNLTDVKGVPVCKECIGELKTMEIKEEKQYVFHISLPRMEVDIIPY